MHGIGKGGKFSQSICVFFALLFPPSDISIWVVLAPGFQTSVKRIRITPEIAARIRRGEEVSPEEIEAASRKADLEPIHKEQTKPSGSTSIGSDFGLGRGAIEERDDRHLINGSEKEEVNEWLPESITKPGKRKRRLK